MPAVNEDCDLDQAPGSPASGAVEVPGYDPDGPNQVPSCPADNPPVAGELPDQPAVPALRPVARIAAGEDAAAAAALCHATLL